MVNSKIENTAKLLLLLFLICILITLAKCWWFWVGLIIAGIAERRGW